MVRGFFLVDVLFSCLTVFLANDIIYYQKQLSNSSMNPDDVLGEMDRNDEFGWVPLKIKYDFFFGLDVFLRSKTLPIKFEACWPLVKHLLELVSKVGLLTRHIFQGFLAVLKFGNHKGVYDQ